MSPSIDINIVCESEKYHEFSMCFLSDWLLVKHSQEGLSVYIKLNATRTFYT